MSKAWCYKTLVYCEKTVSMARHGAHGGSWAEDTGGSLWAQSPMPNTVVDNVHSRQWGIQSVLKKAVM